MKGALFAGIPALVLALGLLACCCFSAECGLDLPAPAQRTWHLSMHAGTIAITVFSTVPEDELYRRYTLPFWLAETLLAPPIGFLVLQFLRPRRRALAAFPVEPPRHHGH